ncbi:hypothetical protein B5X24_HaOG202017 [Helicoverpa armigera]|uniref:Uncharacterized protein n=1 Tax=Helicoverpa armigera TaxID=29058 RepID=A0A2W1BU15_HELAM|nr:hypothetical protein B5X24_HaOG202017 [Helicoverpa armigera]
MLRTREIYPSVFIATAFRSRTGMRVSLRRRNSVDEWFASRRPCRAHAAPLPPGPQRLRRPAGRSSVAASVKVGDGTTPAAVAPVFTLACGPYARF